MKISYNVTGAQRKALVEAISQIQNTPAKYLGMPSAAYEVGGFTVSKDGTVTGIDYRVLIGDLESKYGFVPVTAEYDIEIPQDNNVGTEEYPDIDQHHPGHYANPDAPMTEGMMRQLGESMPEYQNADGDILAIEMPLDGFNDEAFANLEKLIASKAGLIKKALGVETLTVEKAEHRLRFPWFKSGLEPDVFTARAWFISALCNSAKEQKRVTAKEKPVDNEKFAFRVFLIRLGFVGDEYKTARKILLRNLTGNSAFKNGKPEKEELETITASTDINSLEETLADAELIHAVNASFESEA